MVPLLLSLANGLRVRNCNFAAGFGFFALLPVATVLYAAPAGVLAGVAIPRRARLVAFALPVLSLLWALVRLYREPPVFAFDPFGGYFPGPIYDEALRPPPTLVVFRLVNLVWIGDRCGDRPRRGRARLESAPLAPRRAGRRRAPGRRRRWCCTRWAGALGSASRVAISRGRSIGR